MHLAASDLERLAVQQEIGFFADAERVRGLWLGGEQSVTPLTVPPPDKLKRLRLLQIEMI